MKRIILSVCVWFAALVFSGCGHDYTLTVTKADCISDLVIIATYARDTVQIDTVVATKSVIEYPHAVYVKWAYDKGGLHYDTFNTLLLDAPADLKLE